MAQRRMFSPDIVESDAFLEMPPSTQSLYFHLGMKSDDDGFVSPRGIMRLIGATEDDLKVLLGKRFVLPLDGGVLVIKHWRINNFVRKDRYKPTMYLEQKKFLYVKENMAYTLDSEQGEHISEVVWKSDEQARLTSGQPTVNAGKDRLGKDRLLSATRVEITEENENTKSKKEKKDTSYLQVYELFNVLHGKWPLNWKNNRTQIQSAKNLLEERTIEEIEDAINWFKDLKHLEHCYDVSTPWDLDSKWSKFEEFVTKNS